MIQTIILFGLCLLFLCIGIISILIIHGVFETNPSYIRPDFHSQGKPDLRSISIFAQPAAYPGDCFGSNLVVGSRYLASQSKDKLYFLTTVDDTYFANPLGITAVAQYDINDTTTAVITENVLQLFMLRYPDMKLVQTLAPMNDAHMFTKVKLSADNSRLLVSCCHHERLWTLYSYRSSMVKKSLQWAFEFQLPLDKSTIINFHIFKDMFVVQYQDRVVIYKCKQKIFTFVSECQFTAINERFVVIVSSGGVMTMYDIHTFAFHHKITLPSAVLDFTMTNQHCAVLLSPKHTRVFNQEFTSHENIFFETPASGVKLGAACVYTQHPSEYTAVGMLGRHNFNLLK